MSKGGKIVMWIVIILAVLAAVGYYFGNKAWRKISLKVFVSGIDTGNTTLQQAIITLATGNSVVIKLLAGVNITNGNTFSIPVSKFRAKLFYNGTQIAETSPGLYESKIIVPANSQYSITDSADVVIGPGALTLLKGIVVKQKPLIEYEIRFRIWGIPMPFPIKNNFSLNI